MVERAKLSDPNTKYTIRDLSAETMGTMNPRGGIRDTETTGIQTTMVDRNYPWTLACVYADADIVDTDEVCWGDGDTVIIGRMKPFPIGESPLDIGRLYEHLARRMSSEGPVSGKAISATSGIEIAFHDIAGKFLDVPAYQLVGRKYRDEVCVYCNLHTEDEASPQACAEEGVYVIEELSYDTIKSDLDASLGYEKDHTNHHLRNSEVDRKVKIVKTITKATDDRVDATFDCRWSFTGEGAKRLVSELKDCDVRWLEDPMPLESHDMQKLATQFAAAPIAVGEGVYRKFSQRTLFEPQTVDITVPDLSRVGGMCGARKIVDLADMYYIPVAVHNVSSPIGTMTSARTVAAIPSSLAPEYHSYRLGWQGDLIEEDDLTQNGHIETSEKLGLRLTLDLNAVGTHTVGGEALFDEEQPDAESGTVPQRPRQPDTPHP